MSKYSFIRALKQRYSQANNITAQIFSIFWATLTLIMLATLLIPYLDIRQARNLTDNELLVYRKELRDEIRTGRLNQLLSMPIELLMEQPDDGIRPILINSEDKIFGARLNELERIQQFARSYQNPFNALHKTYYDLAIVGPFNISLNDEPYDLYFIRKISPQLEIANFIFDKPILMILLIMLTSSPILWWLASYISSPIRNLQRFANSVALGDFATRPELEKKGVMELRRLAHSLNKMASSLDELMYSQKYLLSSISHELRTPLTRLQLATALLRYKVGDIAEFERINKESDRLDKMINDLLMISRAQLKGHTAYTHFEISQLWEQVIDDALFEAEQRHITLHFKQNIPDPERYQLNGNQGLLASALENVLRNALKYTKNRIQVTIYLAENENAETKNALKMYIQIEDNGNGVPDNEYQNIFKPFYRIDETRTRQTGGAGLGLAIVSNVLQQHYGSVSASKSELGGLSVLLEFPIYREEYIKRELISHQ